MTDRGLQHIFISYVRENSEQVEQLRDALTEHGVTVWLDRYDIKPGARWKDAIREAINNGAFFMACFSDEYHSRAETHMNEELTLAIERLRKIHVDREWFIPVLLSECDVPARSIGGGETLVDINWVPLYDNWDAGLKRILSVIKPVPLIIQNLTNALDSEHTNVRVEVAKALFEVCDPSAVPALSKALKDKDLEVRHIAANALERIGPEAKLACRFLIDALGDVELMRSASKSSLRAIGSNAVPFLIEGLKHKDNKVRANAAEVLGEMGPAAKLALPALIDALKDKNKQTHSVFVRILRKLLDQDQKVRRAAAEALGKIGSEDKLAAPDPAAMEGLKKYKNTKRILSVLKSLLALLLCFTIVYFLFATKDREIVVADFRLQTEAALNTLKDENADFRWWAEQVLRNIGDEWEGQIQYGYGETPTVISNAASVVLKALADRNKLVREAAVQALKPFFNSFWEEGLPRVFPALISATKDESNAVREAAIRVVGEVYWAGAEETELKLLTALIKAFRDESAEVRWSAAEALRGFSLRPGSNAKAGALLIEALKDENAGVRRLATLSLGFVTADKIRNHFQTGQEVPALTEARKDKNVDVRRSVVLSLEIISEAAVLRLIDGFNNVHDSWGVDERKWVAQVFGEIMSEAVIALIEALDDKNEMVCEDAAKALEIIGVLTEAVKPPLVNKRKDGDSDSREIAALTLNTINAIESSLQSRL